MEDNHTFYACQPCLNHSCTKTGCHLNGGGCYFTHDKNSAALLYGKMQFPFKDFMDSDIVIKDIDSGKYSMVHMVSEFLKTNFMEINTSRGYFAIDLGQLLGIDPLYLTLDELGELYSKFGITCRKTIYTNKYALLIEKGELK